MDGMKFTIDGSIKGSKHIASMEYYMDLLSERGSTNGALVRSVLTIRSVDPITYPPPAAVESAIPPPTSLPAAVESAIPPLSHFGCCRGRVPLPAAASPAIHLHLPHFRPLPVCDPPPPTSLLALSSPRSRLRVPHSRLSSSRDTSTYLTSGCTSRQRSTSTYSLRLLPSPRDPTSTTSPPAIV
jgi:hypothetical protein